MAVRAAIFHTPRPGQLETLADALIEIDAAGVITAVGPATPERLARTVDVTIQLPAHHYLLPGFIDLHVHAPQWPQTGRALDVPLEEWLQVHTFPLEARYADTAFAREVYSDLVPSLLAQGTTTALYFATIHVEASIALAEICLALGQRALIGKVAMDAPDECPGFYRDACAEDAIRDTREVINRIRALTPDANPLVQPVITPRFLPSCSFELLKELGVLAAQTGARVQTHCSESPWEVAHGQARFGKSDVAALADFGLLREHTVLAHGNFVNDPDRRHIHHAGAAIAHCPLSNAYFAGRILPLREMLDEGLHLGLGSDLAGGHSPSILDAARMAITASRMREAGDGGPINAVEAFWLATAGAAEALGLPVGHFAPGMEFDALVIDTTGPERIAWPALDSPIQILEKIIRRAGRANIRKVWVRGREVTGA
ncbi:MAG: guanine deaminase [Bradyrhizobium sp.]|nr:guanine deaminase [Bradyrhizobium sp.]